MFGLHILDFWTLVLYFLGVTFTGLWVARKVISGTW